MYVGKKLNFDDFKIMVSKQRQTVLSLQTNLQEFLFPRKARQKESSKKGDMRKEKQR